MKKEYNEEDIIFQQAEGDVIWFDSRIGTGMIDFPEHPNCFFHYSELQMIGRKAVTAGDTVKFDVVRTPKGLVAINILRIK